MWGPWLGLFLATGHPGKLCRGHVVFPLDSGDIRVLLLSAAVKQAPSHAGKSQEELRDLAERHQCVWLPEESTVARCLAFWKALGMMS